MNSILLGVATAFITLWTVWSGNAASLSESPQWSRSSEVRFFCTVNGSPSSVILHLKAKGDLFDISATSRKATIFQMNDQRPSLNVRVVTGTSDAVNEFVDFNEQGLEVVPVDGKNKLEIDLTPESTFVHYLDDVKAIQLKCLIDPIQLILYLGIAPRSEIHFEDVKAVAFDIDDTLMFTSPTFARGFATGGTPKPDDILFWTHTNGCDGGCAESTITLSDGTVKHLPANVPSTPKSKALNLINYHKSLGHEVYAITARPDVNGDPLRDYLESQMGFIRRNIFFEPDLNQPGNPAGKTDRIESLNLDIFYGDSDSDITDTLKAFAASPGVRLKKVHPVRFLRSPKSSNRKAGQLNKYHPGYFGEPILADSY